MKSAGYWIEKLRLQKHPEGGWYKEVYRSQMIIPKSGFPKDFDGERNISTSIYYLLEGDDFSAFHRIKSDEIWHYYAGTSAIEIVWIEKGKLVKKLLGNNFDSHESFQLIVPRNCWFAARLVNDKGYALVGCTVSPGFHFDDFELADESLLTKFSKIEQTEIIDLIH